MLTQPRRAYLNSAKYFSIAIGVFMLLWSFIAGCRNIYHRRHYLFTVQRMLGLWIPCFSTINPWCPGAYLTQYIFDVVFLFLIVQQQPIITNCASYYDDNVANGGTLLNQTNQCAMTKNAINLLPGTLAYQLTGENKTKYLTGRCCAGFQRLSDGQSAEGCMAEAMADPDCINRISYNKRLSCSSPEMPHCPHTNT